MNRRLNLSDTFVTFGILVVLLLVFIAEIIMGGSENNSTLLKLGAMNNYTVVVGGQWWRLFTAQFLHIGILHLVSNAIIIYYMGMYMEPLLGHIRFLVIYLLSGVGGNLLSLALGNDFTISAGASTALFGLFGAMTAVGLHNRHNPVIAFLGRQAFALAIINLALDIFMPGIDIQGHIGGLISGFLLAVIIGDSGEKPYNMKWRVLAGAALILYIVLTFRHGMVVTY
ncbi:rhomboid family intramembrane serine protease [Lactobacillus hamsteri]|uniref:Peptidase S54 rhomboid domain-containing protein n=1 Tax=Lactobacillus hamsteri DSM 5661 = JCM 6256 TaxID=1423754 RepID=A0A0R1YDE2_9LACO|nr:rhomboid family intramembrane serine protease [Lactobacillus hamsteri]KRM40354.1 hypothetical protein FC39_GL000678 [Lactobacillus hamsteri DSM 5661 = JCM 6256]